MVQLLGRHVVDWGKQGIIAAIHEGDVHLWHPSRVLKTPVTTTNGKVKHCIKWNNEGTHLAMAQRGSTIAIWDVQALKVNRIKYSNLVVFSVKYTSTVKYTTIIQSGNLC